MPVHIGIAMLALLLLVVGCSSPNDSSTPTAAAPSRTHRRDTFVIVHGAWGGGWAFREVDRLLRANGHTVYRPTLTGLGERVHLATPDVGLQTHIQDVVN